MGCSRGSLTGNISRNCTSAGWSDIFPNITSVCGSNTSQNKVRASFVAGNVPTEPQTPLEAWNWWRLQGRVLINTVCWRSVGSLGRDVEQQRETCLMGAAPSGHNYTLQWHGSGSKEIEAYVVEDICLTSLTVMVSGGFCFHGSIKVAVGWWADIMSLRVWNKPRACWTFLHLFNFTITDHTYKKAVMNGAVSCNTRPVRFLLRLYRRQQNNITGRNNVCPRLASLVIIAALVRFHGWGSVWVTAALSLNPSLFLIN